MPQTAAALQIDPYTLCFLQIYKGDLLGEGYESSTRLTYLEIPVLARFDLESRSGARPALYIGPSFGIKLGAKAEWRVLGSASSGNIDNVKSLDPGVVLGGVVDIPAGRGAVTLEARYTRGLVSVYDNDGGSDPDIKNSVISILLGYKFGPIR